MTTEAMSQQKSRWASGVIPYAQMGYWKPDYEPKDSDILCAFRLVPQEGVEPDEASAAVAGGIPTPPLAAGWDDWVTAYPNIQTKCTRAHPRPRPEPEIPPNAPTPRPFRA